VLRPDEARSVFGVLAPSMIPFLLSFIFRRAGVKPAAQGNPLAGMLDDY
jgi:hypothetical protein